MDNDLYFDTRNKKGQKYSNIIRYKKDKSIKFITNINRKISKEKKTSNNKVIIDILENKKNQLFRCSWYRVRHSHHCDMCHPQKRKVNKPGKPNTIYRNKEYKNMNFDFVIKK